MELLLLEQGGRAGQGAVGQAQGQGPRQAGGHGPIGHRLGHQGHVGRPGGGEGQEGIELAFGQVEHLTHLGKQLAHPELLLRWDPLAPGQAGEALAHQGRRVGHGPHDAMGREQGLEPGQGHPGQDRNQQGPLAPKLAAGAGCRSDRGRP